MKIELEEITVGELAERAKCFVNLITAKNRAGNVQVIPQKFDKKS